METADATAPGGAAHLELWGEMDPPFEGFEPGILGADFAAELEAVSEIT